MSFRKLIQPIVSSLRKPTAPIASGLLIAALLGVCEPAFAGGLSAATSGLSQFQIWFYSFVGVLALCYLTWKGVESFTDRAHWSDFAIAVGKVAVVGGVVVLGSWAWGLFAS
jgi:hypothetical protein